MTARPAAPKPPDPDEFRVVLVSSMFTNYYTEDDFCPLCEQGKTVTDKRAAIVVADKEHHEFAFTACETCCKLPREQLTQLVNTCRFTRA